PKFDVTAFQEGHLSPVVFGSALKDFCIEELLNCLANWAPGALSRKAKTRVVSPAEDKVTGFVFKVQANMDPNHRDRVAFVRLCSGKFRRGMKLFHAREGRHDGERADLLSRAAARDRRRGISRRYHRHSQSRHATRWRYA